MAEKHVDADPRALRGLAHPLRAALLYELHARGSATATTLADVVGQPVNGVSFHLRQLAKYGLIEDDPLAERTDARQRWWRPTSTDGLRISDTKLSRTREGRAGLAAFRRSAVTRWQALVARFFERHEDDGRVWASCDIPMRLSDDEARACNAEVLGVLKKWHDLGRTAPAEDGQQRRTYLGLVMLMPHQTDLGD